MTATADHTGTVTGRVVRVTGPVVDVEFPRGQVPELYSALEVPVEMRERGGGRSSITALRSIYYMVKVLLAIFVGLFRRDVVPREGSE